MIYVFIDSNVFIGSNYDFEAIQFLRLKYLFKSNLATLLYTDVIKEEVRRHLVVDLEKNIKEYNRIKVKVYGALRGESKYKRMNPKAAIEDAMKAWDNLLANRSAIKLSFDAVNTNDLVKNYVDKRLPFSDDKPNEFKDAINALALLEFVSRTNEKISIISKDNGFRESFANNELFEVFETPRKFFDHYIDLLEGFDNDKNYCNMLKQYFCLTENQILAEIKQYLQNCISITIEDDPRYVYINSIILNIKDLVVHYEYTRYVEKDNQLIVNISFDITLDTIYRDNKYSFFNKNTHNWNHIEIAGFKEEYKVYIDIKFNMELDGTGQKIKTIELVKDYIQLDLDNSMLISSMPDFKTQDELTYKEVCPGCGNLVESQSMDGGFCKSCICEDNVD